MGDFYLADLLSQSHKTLIDKLFVILQDRHYELLRGKNELGLFTSQKAEFRDERKAYDAFWQIYERPPKEEFWDFIISRRDLLVPDDIRERKGAFFTPQIWVQKAQEYLAQSLGEDWQEEYYIWDCAAGTGNLLSGLNNKYRIFASTLDKADVDVMKERVENGANLLDANIFQFDFLNDCFFDKVDEKSGKVLVESKLPKSLQNIIKNEPHKLVIFINPPYAEASNRKTTTNTGENKSQVATNTTIYNKYSNDYSTATRELFAQFFIRIYNEIPNCILASFSTLKYINSQYFQNFRKNFKAKFFKGFAVPANTFDNVNGEFPIGFLIWNLAKKENLKQISVDIFERGDKFLGQKGFYAIPKNSFIIDWLRNFHDKKGKKLTYLRMQGTDFSNNRGCFLANDLSKNDFVKRLFTIVTPKNLIPFCVYLTVRHAIPRTWINDRDQFLYPNDKWQKDTEFQNDCLAFTLFHNQNYIKASISPSPAEGDKGGGYSKYINHFIPFSESQVGAKEAFKSDFMVRFINGKLGKDDTSSLRASKASAAIHNKADSRKTRQSRSFFSNDETLLFDKKEIQADTQSFIPTKPLEFSKEAQEVFSAGLALWRYYHSQAKASDKYLNDASLYDIKEYFQGRAQSTNGKKGKMNARSEDNHYNDLIAQLRITLQTLAEKITPKIYEYEFLLE